MECMGEKGMYVLYMGWPVRLLSKREVWVPVVVSYAGIKCCQYWVGGGVVLWKNCLLGSRSIKNGHKADVTSYIGMLADVKDQGDIYGGPDLEKRGLPQLPVTAIWDLQDWSPVDLGPEGPHMNLKKRVHLKSAGTPAFPVQMKH